MVKGVNKNIIEVNSTGSEIFEKIVFYISPKYASLGAKSLQKASDEIERTLDFGTQTSKSLRLRVLKKQRNKKRIIIASAIVLAVAISSFVIIKLFL